MKSNNRIFSFLAIFSAIFLILPMFLKCWQYDANGIVSERYTYLLWGGFPSDLKLAFSATNGGFADIWAILTAVCAVIALVSAIVFVVFAIMKMCNKGNSKLNYLMCKIFAIMVIVFALLGMIFGAVVFNIVNTFETASGGIYQMMPMVGIYMLGLGGLLTGIFGLMSLKK